MAEIKHSAGDAAITRASSFLEIYSNGVNVRITENDIGLVFVRTVTAPGGAANNEEQVGITMSPQMFKGLALTVLAVLNGYEKELGEIKIVKEPDSQQIRNVFAQLAKRSDRS